MNEALIAGLVGIIVALVKLLEILISWAINKGKEKPDQVLLKRVADDVAQVRAESRDLHMWHDRNDSEGVKIWYVRKSLEDAIVKLADNIGAQTEILRQIHREIQDQRRDLRQLQGKVEELSSE